MPVNAQAVIADRTRQAPPVCLKRIAQGHAWEEQADAKRQRAEAVVGSHMDWRVPWGTASSSSEAGVDSQRAGCSPPTRGPVLRLRKA